MEVGQKIKLVRLHRGLTQKQLGDLLNLGDGGANRIAQYEIGYRVPKPSLLKEIAKVLDVKEETFFVSDKFLPDFCGQLCGMILNIEDLSNWLKPRLMLRLRR